MRQCTVFKLGKIPYDEALSFQFELVERTREKKGRNSFLILLEHPPVITIGKNGDQKNILVTEETLKRKGIIVRRIDRGGDVTYHGPGQLVGYPILSLSHYKKSIREYIAALEECLIQTLTAFGVKAERRPKYIGVWVNEAKIASIGVRVSGGITYHGFALNVDMDLTPFSYLNPCGINKCPITSVSKLTDKRPTVNEVANELIDCYNKVFGTQSVVVKTHLSYLPAKETGLPKKKD
jgi:lipoate-protein ligase B